MTASDKQDLLRKLPAIDSLLAGELVAPMLADHPRSVVVRCLREAVDVVRGRVLGGTATTCLVDEIISIAGCKLASLSRPSIRRAINATGVILHTGLGRAVWPREVMRGVGADLEGYVTLAIDFETGARSERYLRVEHILTELTGAEAAAVVNNNAAATLLALSAMAGGKEAIVSRGQLIEIGGSFRLPDVMSQSGAKLVEVGTTNRTHLKDYRSAITDQTAIIMRVHPSNYRIMGFTSQPGLDELVALAHEHNMPLLDDLGAGALVNLEDLPTPLPHEPTVQESIAAGADVVLFSADKLIGASQGGVIVGRKRYIEAIRNHPLYRALRPDKMCLMVLERTLHLFRDPKRLLREHPLYSMLTATPEALEQRANELSAAISAKLPHVQPRVRKAVGYTGSGSLPMEQLPTFVVAIAPTTISAGELARRLRLDDACVFTRIEGGCVLMDVRTLFDGDSPVIAQALARVLA